MYKKFMLHLLLVAAFSNSQLLHSADDPSEPIRQVITFVITQIGENSSYLFSKITETYQELSTNENVNKGITGLAINLGGAVIFKAGNGLYNYIYPQPEDLVKKEQEKAKQAEAEVRIEEAKKRLKYLKSEANFNECLKSIKKDAQKNAEGIPTKCEEKARELILCDGKAALMVMMKNFNS